MSSPRLQSLFLVTALLAASLPLHADISVGTGLPAGALISNPTGTVGTSAVINPGGIVLTPGTAGTTTVTPSVDTTYTLDVDGEMKSVTLHVFDEPLVTNFGLDNGGGFPFLDAAGLTTDFPVFPTIVPGVPPFRVRYGRRGCGP